jgi:multidrug efflux pump subunit AcrA (membrane-fusion protein)
MDVPKKDLSNLQAWAATESAELAARFVGVVGAQTESIRAELDETRSWNEALRAELQEARERLDAAEVELSQLSAQFERTLDELRHEHASTIREQALSCITLPLDELLTVFNGLERSTSLAEALTALFDGLVREFSRVALFAVRSGRLEGVQQSGFEFEQDISKVVIPMSSDSLLGRSVSSGRIEGSLAGVGSGSTGMPFGGEPGCAVALPISIQGVVAAVIYADDSDRLEFASTAPQALVKFAELLLMHATLVLFRISAEQRLLRREMA